MTHGPTGKGGYKFGESPFRFAHQDVIGASIKIVHTVIRSIRSVHDDFRTVSPGKVDHSESDLAHSSQAHLGEKIEIVFVYRDNLGRGSSDSFRESLLGIFQHAVE